MNCELCLMICLEYLHSFFQLLVLVVFDKRGADAQTLLMRASGDEADGADTIIHQFVSQLATRHAGITDGEVETVGNRLVSVLVIYDVESVA